MNQNTVDENSRQKKIGEISLEMVGTREKKYFEK